MTANDTVINVRDLVVGFGGATVLDTSTLDVQHGEILGFVGGFRRRQVGADAHDHRAVAQARRHDRGFRPGYRRVERDASAVRSNGAGACCFSRARYFPRLTVQQNIEFPMREYLKGLSHAADRRNRACQAENGRPQRQRPQKISVRIVRRHDQARGARSRAGARSRHRLSRRADLRPRSDRCRRVRRTDSRPCSARSA